MMDLKDFLLIGSPPREIGYRSNLLRRARIPPPSIKPADAKGSEVLLELGVNTGQKRSDSRTHGLVSNEYHHRDRRKDQRVLGHRLTARRLTRLHVQSCKVIHLGSPFNWRAAGCFRP